MIILPTRQAQMTIRLLFAAPVSQGAILRPYYSQLGDFKFGPKPELSPSAHIVLPWTGFSSASDLGACLAPSPIRVFLTPGVS